MKDDSSPLTLEIWRLRTLQWRFQLDTPACGGVPRDQTEPLAVYPANTPSTRTQKHQEKHARVARGGAAAGSGLDGVRILPHLVVQDLLEHAPWHEVDGAVADAGGKRQLNALAFHGDQGEAQGSLADGYGRQLGVQLFRLRGQASSRVLGRRVGIEGGVGTDQRTRKYLEVHICPLSPSPLSTKPNKKEKKKNSRLAQCLEE